MLFYHPSDTRLDMAGFKLTVAIFLVALLPIITPARAGAQGQLLTTEKMETVLRRHVLEAGPWKPENVEVRIVAFQPVSLPSGPVNYRILKPSKGITPGLRSFLVAADVTGKEEARMWIKTEIKIFEQVVVSSYPLAHHELVSAKDVRLDRREISSVFARPFTRIDDVVGKQAARAIEVNEILTQNSVDRPTLIRRGSSIVLLYETSNLRVETPGLAEEGGKIGDLIQVKNPTSGNLLRGVVLDGRTVRIN